MQIYWLSDELRRMYDFGLEETPLFKKKLKKVQAMQKKLEEAEKVFNSNISTYQNHLHIKRKNK